MNPTNQTPPLRTINISDLTPNHPINPTTRIRFSSSGGFATNLPPNPETTRPNLSLPQILLTSSLVPLMPEIEYTVPSHVFAESCPVCDEIATDTEERREGWVARYPKGWVLVSCKRHTEVLRATSAGGGHVVVGGQPELQSKAALRYREREKVRKQAKRATTLAPSADETPPATTPTTQKHTDLCPICFSSPAHLHLDCTHTFCTSCLTNWQSTSLDAPLSSWLTNPYIQTHYPILSANLKSRFTCPMCRANLQFTKQSRRQKKMRNRRERGEVTGGMGARSRRGGQRHRRRRGDAGVMRSEWVVPCVEAPPPESMPVVERA